MANQVYSTRDGDVLDEIVWNYYGTRSGLAVEVVLAANIGLSDYPPRFPAGVRITLPDLPKPAAGSKVVKLWD